MINIQCRLCGQKLEFPDETPAALQVLKNHNRRHIMQTMKLIADKGVGHFLDALLFESATQEDAQAWKSYQLECFEYVLSKEALS